MHLICMFSSFSWDQLDVKLDSNIAKVAELHVQIAVIIHEN